MPTLIQVMSDIYKFVKIKESTLPLITNFCQDLEASRLLLHLGYRSTAGMISEADFNQRLLFVMRLNYDQRLLVFIFQEDGSWAN